MCTRAAPEKGVKLPTGDLKMKIIMWFTLLLFLCSTTKEMVLEQTKKSRGLTAEVKSGLNISRNLKRHSDGMFTSDLTNYLDKIKAKNFVEWLAAIKQQECQEKGLETADNV